MISLKFAGRIALMSALVILVAACEPSKRKSLMPLTRADLNAADPYGRPKADQPPATEAELRAIREAIQNRDCTDRSARDITGQYNGKDIYRALSDIPLEEVQAFYSDKTHVSYGLGSHGTQIEYTSADGEAHLWYPGNSRILHGRWNAKRDGDQTKICFAYEEGTYNPETGHVGGDFECGQFHSSRLGTVDLVEGDLFQLARTDNVARRLEKDAVKPYVPNCLPVKIPHLTDGKSPAQHLLVLYPPQPTR